MHDDHRKLRFQESRSRRSASVSWNLRGGRSNWRQWKDRLPQRAIEAITDPAKVIGIEKAVFGQRAVSPLGN